MTSVSPPSPASEEAEEEPPQADAANTVAVKVAAKRLRRVSLVRELVIVRSVTE